MEQNNVVEFPAPKELSEVQRHHWEDQLVNAERAYKYALRMLGRLSIENEQTPRNTIETPPIIPTS
jgi:hypothetical protein